MVNHKTSTERHWNACAHSCNRAALTKLRSIRRVCVCHRYTAVDSYILNPIYYVNLSASSIKPRAWTHMYMFPQSHRSRAALLSKPKPETWVLAVQQHNKTCTSRPPPTVCMHIRWTIKQCVCGCVMTEERSCLPVITLALISKNVKESGACTRWNVHRLARVSESAQPEYNLRHIASIVYVCMFKHRLHAGAFNPIRTHSIEFG